MEYFYPVLDDSQTTHIDQSRKHASPRNREKNRNWLLGFMESQHDSLNGCHKIELDPNQKKVPLFLAFSLSTTPFFPLWRCNVLNERRITLHFFILFFPLHPVKVCKNCIFSSSYNICISSSVINLLQIYNSILRKLQIVGGYNVFSVVDHRYFY